jgi:AcrR family transcriptional regulator
MSNRVEHTKRALIEAMEASLGVVTTACKKVGVSRTTFYEYYKTDEDFKNTVDELEAVALDFAESQLRPNNEGQYRSHHLLPKDKGQETSLLALMSRKRYEAASVTCFTLTKQISLHLKIGSN